MKKVLIITYYWPPAGGPGVQRVLKFAKYLPEFNWKPIILTVKHPDAPIYDESLFADIPEEVKIYKTRALEPFGFYRKFTGKSPSEKIPNDILLSKKNASLQDRIAKWVRANIFIPDAKIGWLHYAVKEGMKIVRQEKVDAILNSSPPPTTALVGKAIAKKTGLPWIADFRDPWLEIVYYQHLKRSKLTKAIDGMLERKVLRKADVVVAISKDMINLFKSKVGDKKFKVIPNGYDEIDFENQKSIKNDKFTIAYTGTISKDRIPYSLITAIKRFVYEDKNENFRLNFAGRFSSEFVNLIRKENVEKYFELQDFVPHKVSTSILQNADALLLIIDDVPNNKGFLTGKLFEYLGCKKPVFAIGPLDGNANEILKETNSGIMVDYKDTNAAYMLLKKLYRERQLGKTAFEFKAEKYSRENLTYELSQILDEIIK